MDEASLSWYQLGEDIDGESEGDQAGWSVSLSADGESVAVGSIFNDDNGAYSGHVRVFKTELWKQQGQSIAGNSSGDWSGSSVSLSSDGRTLAIGSPGNNTFPSDVRPGYANVYRRASDGGEWELEQTILGEAEGDLLGQSVSLSGDGKTVAVGAPGQHWGRNDRPGYVKVYHMNDGVWRQLGQVITGEALGNQFGISVSLSSNGKTLAVGANMNDNKNGQWSWLVEWFL